MFKTFLQDRVRLED